MSVVAFGPPKRKADPTNAPTFLLPAPQKYHLYVAQKFVDADATQAVTEALRGFFIKAGAPDASAAAATAAASFRFGSFTIPKDKMILVHAGSNSNYGGGDVKAAQKKLLELEFGGAPKRTQSTGQTPAAGATYVNMKIWTPRSARGLELKQIAIDDSKLIDLCSDDSARPRDLKAFEKYLAKLPAQKVPTYLLVRLGLGFRADWTEDWARVAEALCSEGFDDAKQLFLANKARYMKAFRIFGRAAGDTSVIDFLDALV